MNLPPLVVDLVPDAPDPIRRKNRPSLPDVYIISGEPAHDEDKDAVAAAFILSEAKELQETEVETEADVETDTKDDDDDE
ncbi:hypothetical protein Q9L58_010344 [Maublancomyces gigas]|uniref:Uncharacterized protein n=1 Tax=Discina gigas TaxID=1032678 RepID=A0ABR3G4U4_9PEZI